MAFVVTENCINCKHTTCVEVCPTDAFREGANFLVIDPDSCIDCNLCPAECPEEAIYELDAVPENQKSFIELNEALAQKWPIITATKPPLTHYTKWSNIADKIDLLQLD